MTAISDFAQSGAYFIEDDVRIIKNDSTALEEYHLSNMKIAQLTPDQIEALMLGELIVIEFISGPVLLVAEGYD